MAESIYILTDAAIVQKVGETIRRVRIAKHITQEQLAQSADVAVSSVRNVEQGKNISFYTLIRILRTLQLMDTLHQLTAGEEQSPVMLAAQATRSTKRQRQSPKHQRAVPRKAYKRPNSTSEW